LVLDNFEHLLGAAPLLNELLTNCPQLTILVTSRAALRLRFERCFPVAALTTSEDHEPDGVIADSDGVRLFVERARSFDPAFQLDATNIRCVAAVCRHLDGMPLAIELAASRVRLLGLDGLLRRVRRILPLLTYGAADLPERQRSVRQTLA